MNIEEIQALHQEINLFKQFLYDVHPHPDQTLNEIFEAEKTNFIGLFKNFHFEVGGQKKEQEHIKSTKSPIQNTKISDPGEFRFKNNLNVLISLKEKDLQSYIKKNLPEDIICLDNLDQINLNYPLVVFVYYCERLFEDNFIDKVNQMNCDQIFIIAFKYPSIPAKDELNASIGKKHGNVYIFSIDFQLKYPPKRKDNLTFLSILKQAGYKTPINPQLKFEKEPLVRNESAGNHKHDTETKPHQSHAGFKITGACKPDSSWWGFFH